MSDSAMTPTDTSGDKFSVVFVSVGTASAPPRGVDVWLLNLATIAPIDSAKFSAIVSADELIRAHAFKKNQHYFLATRVLLRRALAHYTGVTAPQLAFARTEQGKPFLTNAPTQLYFNLTHSGDFAALAISAQGEIGIDLEVIRQRSYLTIAERYFHADELEQLLAHPEAEREEFFFKLWTLKEAFFKATGGGISTGLDKAAFYLQDNSIQAVFADTLNVQQNAWQFQQEFITPTILIALALNSSQALEHQWLDGNSLLADE